MNLPGLERAGGLLLILFGSRVWAKWRTARRERTALTTPLFDAVLLETVFVPRPQDGDDPDLLAEMRDTFRHLNRRAYAEEFWGLHTQLVALYEKLAEPQCATMRRALLRLLLVNDRWLQLVAAKACADLKMPEAVPLLRALLEPDTSPPADAADVRYRQELEQALATLTAPDANR
ncbi:MAG: hypothetical protein JO250_01200 [Armatimonadetes bacterium]|nr:hypothetical protein [Armatimonadota bacterium]